jgi:hypothetical protein
VALSTKHFLLVNYLLFAIIVILNLNVFLSDGGFLMKVIFIYFYLFYFKAHNHMQPFS